MPIFTLTTDWNRDDFYVAATKGRLLSLVPDATIVDVSHRIESYNFAQAAFVLRNSFRFFPEGTIHLIDINSDYSEATPHTIVKAEGHYFVGADNGMFNLLFENGVDVAVDVKAKDELLGSFQMMSVFVPLGVALSQGARLEELGTPKRSFSRSVPILPIVEDGYISGHILHVDSYRNAISNISREVFEEARRGRDFLIHVQSKQNEITKISRNYAGKALGELIALFNSADLLEISINKGYAAELMNLTSNSTLRVTFL